MQWLIYTLRGISQIFFVSNALSGALIIVGVALFNPLMAALMLLGSLVQSGVGSLHEHKEEVVDGRMGFNGALVGAFAGFAHLPLNLAILATLLGAVACVPVHNLVAKLFASSALSKAALPVSTAPFCLVAGTLKILTLTFFDPVAASSSSQAGLGLLLSLGNSFAEVVLADGWLTGLIIITALFIGSVQVGVFGLVGVLVADLTAFALLHSDISTISTGLQGYSAVLVAIALGAIFWTQERLTIRFLGVVLASAVTLVIGFLLALTPIPVFTWPFLLTMWLFMLAKMFIDTSAKQPLAHHPAEAL